VNDLLGLYIIYIIGIQLPKEGHKNVDVFGDFEKVILFKSKETNGAYCDKCNNNLFLTSVYKYAQALHRVCLAIKNKDKSIACEKISRF
jgi:hypothetical protein